MINKQVKSSERERELKTTPTTTITLDDVRKELKITGSISLNDTKVRELAKKPSGIISMADLRGKTLKPSIPNTPQECDYYFETIEDFENRRDKIIAENNNDLSKKSFGFSDNITEGIFFNLFTGKTPYIIFANNLKTIEDFLSGGTLTYISPILFKYCPNIENAKNLFYSTNIECEIPEELFKYNSKIKTFESLFDTAYLKTIPAKLFYWSINAENFDYLLYSSGSPKDGIIPFGLFNNCKKANTFFSSFLTDLIEVPFNLFDNCQNIVNVGDCFYDCSNITSSLPDVWNKDKFPNLTFYSGYAYGCTNAANYDQIPPEFKGE